MRKLLMLLWVGLTGCVAIPDGLSVVQGFEVDRFTGQWFEIARLDHSFERGLSQVTATYTKNPDGSLKVVNRGYNAAKGRWKEAEGVARFTGEQTTGALKVSFFGPFYGSYNVIDLDPEYRWALIAGPDRTYLWLLSRTPTLPVNIQEQILARARQLGFAPDKLVPGQ